MHYESGLYFRLEIHHTRPGVASAVLGVLGISIRSEPCNADNIVREVVAGACMMSQELQLILVNSGLYVEAMASFLPILQTVYSWCLHTSLDMAVY